MENREGDLLALGIDTSKDGNTRYVACQTQPYGFSLLDGFSNYSVYTPIVVQPFTRRKANADLERDQQRIKTSGG